MQTVPHEYSDVVNSLFPSDGSETTLKAVEDYAKYLGIESYYKNISGESPDKLRRFLEVFKKNLTLIIAKTWTDSTDIMRKEILQAKLPAFFQKIEQLKYREALIDFSVILSDLAYLLFGGQSRMEDFSEYAFRINIELGLFWCYGSRIATVPNNDPEINRALIKLGMCYLINL
jgi:hypothetical protein